MSTKNFAQMLRGVPRNFTSKKRMIFIKNVANMWKNLHVSDFYCIFAAIFIMFPKEIAYETIIYLSLALGS